MLGAMVIGDLRRFEIWHLTSPQGVISGLAGESFVCANHNLGLRGLRFPTLLSVDHRVVCHSVFFTPAVIIHLLMDLS